MILDGAAGCRQDRLGVELDARGCRVVSIAIDHASDPSTGRSAAVTVKPPFDVRFPRVQGVVAGGGELRREAGNRRSRARRGPGSGPACRCCGSGSSDSSPPACSTIACRPRQDAERGQLPRVELG